MPLGAIVLAAGQSRRMGSNKLLADLNGKPLIAHVLDALKDAGLPPPIVVLGHEAEAVKASMGARAFQPASCPDYDAGMAHSLRSGIGAVPHDWDAAMVCLGDMPLINAALIRALATLASKDAIVAPVKDGRRGNPVVWGRDFFPDMLGLTGDEGARAVIAQHQGQLRLIDWNDDSIFMDADTPDALAAVRAFTHG